MPLTNEKSIELINNQISAINIPLFTTHVDSNVLFEEWKKVTEDYLIRIFGEGSREVSEFESINYSPYVISLDTNFTPYKIEGLKTAKLKLERFVKNIEDFGIVANKVVQDQIPRQKSSGITINNHNNNNLSQEININFILNNVLDELEESQKKELKKELEEYQKGNSSPKKIINYLGTFSTGVIQNILAGIITNPSIIQQLIGKL